MNQQNNPNDLNQTQSVNLILRYDPDKNYTLRMRLLPDRKETWDKHPGNHEKQTDYDLVKDDGNWEFIFSKEYVKDTNITKKVTPTQELLCLGNAVGQEDSDFAWKKVLP